MEMVETLEKLHSAGIKTYAMIAPILPRAEGLVEQLSKKADFILIDKMNYHYADWVYRRHRLEYAMTQNFFNRKKAELSKALDEEKISYQFLF